MTNLKLTRRQVEFINKLIELNSEIDGPIHYSLLAERLGVSPFTAYDMLCLLEEKGFVYSEYQLSSDKTGPGRAERVFYPSKTAEVRSQRLAKKTGDVKLEGEELQKFIVDWIREEKDWEKEIAEELLARIPPEGEEQIRYCMEIMTIVALRLRQASGRQVLLQYLPEILTNDTTCSHTDLNLLGGFVFGILAQEEHPDQEWAQIAFEYIQQYQDIVMTLSTESCRQLGEYLIGVFTSLPEDTSTNH